MQWCLSGVKAQGELLEQMVEALDGSMEKALQLLRGKRVPEQVVQLLAEAQVSEEQVLCSQGVWTPPVIWCFVVCDACGHGSSCAVFSVPVVPGRHDSLQASPPAYVMVELFCDHPSPCP